MFFRLTIFAMGSFALCSARADDPATPPDLEVESLSNESSIIYDFQAHTWVGSHGIIARQGSTVLIANEARGDDNTHQVVADGMVSLQAPNLYWTGDHLEFNFNTHQI